jgi:hypothetical protein
VGVQIPPPALKATRSGAGHGELPIACPPAACDYLDVRLLIVLAAVLLIGTAATHSAVVGVVLAALACGGFWLASIYFTPFRRCRTCSGTGRQSGALFTWANRQCPACAGSGRHRRYFVTPIYGDNQTRGEARAYAARLRSNRPR